MRAERTLLEGSRAKRLRTATTDQHELLDASMQVFGAFADRERYGRFLRVQQVFNRDVDALYFNARLGQLIPKLAGNDRLGLIEQDLTDLGLEPNTLPENRKFDCHTDVDLPRALGWLYVAEESKLGAAVLLTRAEKLGYSASFGARHLAAAPEGRALHWKTFTGALDALHLRAFEEPRVVDGARAAFSRMLQYVVHWLLAPGQGKRL